MSQLSREDKLAIRLETGLVSERGTAFSLLRDSQIPDDKTNINDFDYRTFWIGDIVAWKVIEGGAVFGYTEEEKEFYHLSYNELKLFQDELERLRIKNPKEYEKKVPKVFVTGSEIREKLGMRKLLNSEIHQLALSFMKIVSPRKIDDNEVEYDTICKLRERKTGKYSSRGNKPEYLYTFIFDRIASLSFWNCLHLGFFDVRPLSYYRLKGGSQLIYRAVGWTETYSTLRLSELCRIANVRSTNITWQQKVIEGYLDELKLAGFIVDWIKDIAEKSKREIDTIWYTILKVKANKLPKK